MNTQAGVWIDHRRSVVVTRTDNKETTHQVLSRVDKQLGRHDGIRSVAPFEKQLMQADDKQQRGFTNHLNTFYHEVVAHIGDAKEVLIFGPGEAKTELKKFMERDNHRNVVVDMESADKMTDRQISAKVHEYFAGKSADGHTK